MGTLTAYPPVCTKGPIDPLHQTPKDTASMHIKGTKSVLPVFHDGISDAEMEEMVSSATTASNFLKAIGHEGRLMILCHLVNGEKSVTELENLLSARQAAVSQQLARLRLEGLVQTRRDGKAIYYSLTDDRAKRIMEVVYDLFCKSD